MSPWEPPLLLESGLSNRCFAHNRGLRNSFEIVRIRTTQWPGKSRSTRWPNYKRSILTSLFFLNYPLPYIHNFKILAVVHCSLTFVIPPEWSHPLELRSEKAKMLRTEKTDSSSQRSPWFNSIIHKNWRLSMPDYKMGREWWNAEKVSKSWFSSLMEMQRSGNLSCFSSLTLLANLPVIHHFLMKTQSWGLNTVSHSFQLILWKAAVNIPAKKRLLISKAQLEASECHRSDLSRRELDPTELSILPSSCLFHGRAMRPHN